MCILFGKQWDIQPSRIYGTKVYWLLLTVGYIRDHINCCGRDWEGKRLQCDHVSYSQMGPCTWTFLRNFFKLACCLTAFEIRKVAQKFGVCSLDSGTFQKKFVALLSLK